MGRPRHPDKHIEKAIQYAEQLGWTVEMSNGHAWGRLFCPHHFRDGCKVTVNSTPEFRRTTHVISRARSICAHTLGSGTPTRERQYESELG